MMMSNVLDYKALCEDVCEIALATGGYIASCREGFSADDIEFKGRHNLVSYVDKTAEQRIVDALRKLLPDAGFVTEEGTAGCGNETLKWIIDPLDGTTNFIHGLPPYCVSIALMEGAELVVGVVYEVTLKELFYAWKGSDAYLNGRRIEVSRVATLENSLVAVGFSYSLMLDQMDRFLQQVAYYQKNTNGIRRLGSSTADLVYVACGRFEAFCQAKLSPWDVAAGALIVERAGGVVSDYSGGSNYVFGCEIVATNKLVYKEFMDTLRV